MALQKDDNIIIIIIVIILYFFQCYQILNIKYFLPFHVFIFQIYDFIYNFQFDKQ